MKSKCKDIRSVRTFWSSIPKRKRHTKKYQAKKLFIIVLYSILRLCNTQSPMIVLRCLLKFTMSQSWFQNFYCKCLSEKSTIAWWFHHKRSKLRIQEMNKIISSLGIKPYIKFFHIKSRKCLHGKKSCVVVSVPYMPKLCINIYYHGGIVIWRNSNI